MWVLHDLILVHFILFLIWSDIARRMVNQHVVMYSFLTLHCSIRFILGFKLPCNLPSMAHWRKSSQTHFYLRTSDNPIALTRNRSFHDEAIAYHM